MARIMSFRQLQKSVEKKDDRPDLEYAYPSLSIPNSAFICLTADAITPMDLGIRFASEKDIREMMPQEYKERYTGHVLDFPWIKNEECYIITLIDDTYLDSETPVPGIFVNGQNFYTNIDDYKMDTGFTDEEISALPRWSRKSFIAGMGPDVPVEAWQWLHAFTCVVLDVWCLQYLKLI